MHELRRSRSTTNKIIMSVCFKALCISNYPLLLSFLCSPRIMINRFTALNRVHGGKHYRLGRSPEIFCPTFLHRYKISWVDFRLTLSWRTLLQHEIREFKNSLSKRRLLVLKSRFRNVTPLKANIFKHEAIVEFQNSVLSCWKRDLKYLSLAYTVI